MAELAAIEGLRSQIKDNAAFIHSVRLNRTIEPSSIRVVLSTRFDSLTNQTLWRAVAVGVGEGSFVSDEVAALRSLLQKLAAEVQDGHGREELFAPRREDSIFAGRSSPWPSQGWGSDMYWPR